jgi:hypothetical protein
MHLKMALAMRMALLMARMAMGVVDHIELRGLKATIQLASDSLGNGHRALLSEQICRI